MNKMEELLNHFDFINCPEGNERCIGIAVSIEGSGVELKQRENGYIVRNRDGNVTFGNCSHYEICCAKIIKKSAIRRDSSEIKPYGTPYI